MTQLLDLVIDSGILGDIGVRACNIRLGLVIIIITDEILHRILGEKLLELSVKLCRQSLIMCDHQRRPLYPLYHIGHSKGLAAARHAQQRLVRLARQQTGHQPVHRLRLIARQFIFGMYLKIHNAPPLQQPAQISQSSQTSISNITKSFVSLYYTTNKRQNIYPHTLSDKPTQRTFARHTCLYCNPTAPICPTMFLPLYPLALAAPILYNLCKIRRHTHALRPAAQANEHSKKPMR